MRIAALENPTLTTHKNFVTELQSWVDFEFNKIKHSLTVANRVLKMVSQSVTDGRTDGLTDGLQELLELLFSN